jgi:hypothetical protein
MVTMQTPWGWALVTPKKSSRWVVGVVSHPNQIQESIVMAPFTVNVMVAITAFVRLTAVGPAERAWLNATQRLVVQGRVPCIQSPGGRGV